MKAYSSLGFVKKWHSAFNIACLLDTVMDNDYRSRFQRFKYVTDVH